MKIGIVICTLTAVPLFLQFRAETFNVFNMPQFNNPAASIGAAGVGTITSSGAPYQFARLSREIQLALRLYF